MPLLILSIYCLLIAGGALLGGWLPSLLRLTHTRMQLMMSLVGGLMLGVALLHLLPHSYAETGNLDRSVGAVLAGVLVMFFLIRIFHVHQHGSEEEDHAHHDCDHDHSSEGPDCDPHRQPYGWLGLALGLGLHTLADGAALAASISAHGEGAGEIMAASMGVFLAIFLHKPLDALSITSVMAISGWTGRWRWIVSAVFAMVCPLGAFGFYWGLHQIGGAHSVLGDALGFSAGAFLCIALADLLPEVRFHKHDRLKLSAALALGLLLSWGIGWLEPSHAHHGHGDAHHGHNH